MENLIYSLITLAVLILFMLTPLIRKKKLEKIKEANRITRAAVVEKKPARKEGSIHGDVPHRTVPKNHRPQGKSQREAPSPVERIEMLPNLKRAVVWSEILSKPMALKE